MRITMQDNTDYTMLYRIAKYYYIDNMSQSEIALKEHMSRPHVKAAWEGTSGRDCGN